MLNSDSVIVKKYPNFTFYILKIISFILNIAMARRRFETELFVLYIIAYSNTNTWTYVHISYRNISAHIYSPKDREPKDILKHLFNKLIIRIINIEIFISIFKSVNVCMRVSVSICLSSLLRATDTNWRGKIWKSGRFNFWRIRTVICQEF